jgi:hypothetical protein
MIRCDALIWDKLDQGGFQQLHRNASTVSDPAKRTRALLGSRSNTPRLLHPPSRSILWFDPRREHSSSRPPNPAAAARRACQGWPRLRGHPLGRGLDWPEHGGTLIGSGVMSHEPHHGVDRMESLDWRRRRGVKPRKPEASNTLLCEQ